MRACVIRAYTLVEVMIVLGLLSTILLFISMALDIHLRQMTVERTEVEEAQLAYTILKMIERDILSIVIAVREESIEVDTSMLTGVMGVEGAADLLEGLEGETTEATEEGYLEEEDVMIYGTIPGIYGGTDIITGGMNWLQIDTTKLPRGEMYASRQVRRGAYAVDRLSATKTILYYLGKDTQDIIPDDPRYLPELLMGSVGRPLDSSAPQFGLFRRQLDRQAMQYAIQEGIEAEYELDDELLAPEVVGIWFDFWDPTIDLTGMMGDWITEWDMDDRQMLPSAVRITIAIRRPNLGRSFMSLGQTTPPEPVKYSLIVPIPVSIDAPPTEEESGEEMGTEIQ
jgi:hypothetical protein